YVAPERLLMPRCLSLLAQANIALFAIDEAHCVSQWGHDFRPEYIGLSVLAERFADVPRIALTATADAMTRKEIAERQSLTDAPCFVSSF
ncbi:ATP-dependent DNA helicase RecQ, partial [Escherichia coli]|nr:ATP-dependent DNA helicase RecQ [Escherichia coli]